MDELTERWRSEILPTISRQPGCVRVELYESSIREHWVLSVTWKDETARTEGLPRLAELRLAFLQYERFEPEILTLRSSSENQ